MKRKNKKEIQKYYQINDVASTYDDRRFVGKGGEYINSTEVKTTLNIMKKCLRVDSPKILDLGSGRGRLSIPLKKAGYNTYCLDSSVSMLSFLTKEFGREHIYIQSVFDKLPSNNKFDGVTSLRFFDHFDEADQIKILINVSKSLKKDGKPAKDTSKQKPSPKDMILPDSSKKKMVMGRDTAKNDINQ